MLILNRKVGERIIIGDKIVVTMKSIKGNQISIGTASPKEIPVHHEEIYRQLQRKKVSLAGNPVNFILLTDQCIKE